MSSPEPVVEEWLIPNVVLRVVTVVFALVTLVQVAVWATICVMTANLVYAWWLWSALIGAALVGALWLYNAILVRVIDDD